MSEKIVQTIEVLKAISNMYPTNCDFKNYKKLRIEAEKLVKDQHG